MERISTDSKAVDLHGTGKHGFKDPGAPGIGGTVADEAWFNSVQEELANPVEASGQAVAPANARDQLLQALRMLAVAESLGVFGTSDAAATSGGDEITGVAWGKPDSGDSRTAAVACGKNATLLVAEDGGVDWTALTPDASYTGDFKDIVYCNDTIGYLTCGTGREIQQIVSTSYTVTRKDGAGAQTLNSIAYSPTLNRVVVVGDAFSSAATIRTAEGGALGTWTGRTAGSSFAGDFHRVIWDSYRSLFVACGTSGEIQTSPDGITWTRRQSDAGIGTLTGLAAVSKGTVAVKSAGTAGATVYRSADDLTWAAVNTGAGGSERVGGNCLAVNGILVVPERVYGTTGVYLSANGGLGWSLRSQPEVSRYATTSAGGALIFDGRRFHLANASGVLRVSGVVNDVL